MLFTVLARPLQNLFAMARRPNPYPSPNLQNLFAMERRVFHYTASSNNASYATSRERGLAGTFHSDLLLPPAVLEAALSHVLRVGGELSAYRFRSFAY